MDKLKNIISPGHQKDAEMLYGPSKRAGNTGTITGEGTHLAGSREQTVRHKHSDSGYAFSGADETPQQDLPGAFPHSEQPTPMYETGEAEPQIHQLSPLDEAPQRQIPLMAQPVDTTPNDTYEPAQEPRLQQQHAMAAPATIGTDPFVASNRLQADNPNDDTSIASIKSGVVGRSPSQKLTQMSPPSDSAPVRPAESAMTGAAVGSAAAAYENPVPQDPVPQERIDTSKNGVLHQSSTYTHRSYALQGSNSSKEDVEDVEHSELMPPIPDSSTYDRAAPEQQEHHYGRDAAVAGAAGLGAGAAYEGLHDHKGDTASSQQQASTEVKHPETGPASRTIGPHKSNILNILDPRVRRDSQKTKHKDAQQTDAEHHRGRDAAVAGGATAAGVGAAEARKSHEGKRAVDSEPYTTEAWKGHEDKRAVSSEPYTNPYSSKPLDPRVDGAAPTAAAAQQHDYHDQHDHHYGRDAAVVGAGAALGAGAYGAEDAYKQEPQLTRPRSTYEDQRAEPTPETQIGQQVAPETLLREQEEARKREMGEQHHYGRNAAVAGAVGAAGVGTYEAKKHHDATHAEPSTTAAPYQPAAYGAEPSTAAAPYQPAAYDAEHDKHSHVGRDVALGTGATVAGLTAAEEYELHKRRAEEAEAAMREQQREQQREQAQRSRSVSKEHKLLRRHDEQNLKAQARDQEKQARKAEKQQEKEARREAKRADKEMELEAKKQEKEIRRIEREQDMAVRQLDKEQEMEEKGHDKEKRSSLFGFLHRDKDKHADEKMAEESEEKKGGHSDVAMATGAGALAAGATGAGAYEYEEHRKSSTGSMSRGLDSRDTQASNEHADREYKTDKDDKPRRRSSIIDTLFRRTNKSRRSSAEEASAEEASLPPSPTEPTSPTSPTSPTRSTHSSGARSGGSTGRRQRNRLHKEMPKKYAERQRQRSQEQEESMAAAAADGQHREVTATHSGLPNDGERPLAAETDRARSDSPLPIEGYNDAQPEMSFGESRQPDFGAVRQGTAHV